MNNSELNMEGKCFLVNKIICFVKLNELQSQINLKNIPKYCNMFNIKWKNFKKI